MGAMSDEEALLRLARAIATRRDELGLTVQAAARRGEIDRETWAAAEKAQRRLTTPKLTGVEKALGWTPGSARAILAGGEPTLAPGATQVVRPDGIRARAGVGQPGVVHGKASAELGGLAAEMSGSAHGDMPPSLAQAVADIARLHSIPVGERMQMVRDLIDMHLEAQERAARQEAGQPS